MTLGTTKFVHSLVLLWSQQVCSLFGGLQVIEYFANLYPTAHIICTLDSRAFFLLLSWRKYEIVSWATSPFLPQRNAQKKFTAGPIFCSWFLILFWVWIFNLKVAVKKSLLQLLLDFYFWLVYHFESLILWILFSGFKSAELHCCLFPAIKNVSKFTVGNFSQVKSHFFSAKMQCKCIVPERFHNFFLGPLNEVRLRVWYTLVVTMLILSD